MPGGQDPLHPFAPPIIEAPHLQNGKEARPVHGVEGFPEVDFGDDGRGPPGVTASNEIRGVDNVFRDAPPRKESGLVSVNKRVDGSLEP